MGGSIATAIGILPSLTGEPREAERCISVPTGVGGAARAATNAGNVLQDRYKRSVLDRHI